eukprot:scaffold235888_cov27-Tisochrysis_lutea.AAC.1
MSVKNCFIRGSVVRYIQSAFAQLLTHPHICTQKDALHYLNAMHTLALLSKIMQNTWPILEMHAAFKLLFIHQSWLVLIMALIMLAGTQCGWHSSWWPALVMAGAYHDGAHGGWHSSWHSSY